MQHDSDQPRDNSRMMGKLLMAAILMCGFGFALVPFYEKMRVRKEYPGRYLATNHDRV